MILKVYDDENEKWYECRVCGDLCRESKLAMHRKRCKVLRFLYVGKGNGNWKMHQDPRS